MMTPPHQYEMSVNFSISAHLTWLLLLSVSVRLGKYVKPQMDCEFYLFENSYKEQTIPVSDTM